MNLQEFRPRLEQKRDPIDPVIIKKGIQTALLVVAGLSVRANAKEHAEGRLEYHTTAHTETVVRRYKEIVAAISRMSTVPVDAREVQIGELAASWHDTVRATGEEVTEEPETSEFAGMSKLIRKGTNGLNEKESEDLLVSFMDEINRDIPGTFTEEDKQTGRKHISVTVPDFDKINHTVFQPNLNETSSVPMRALALADIGAAGMGTPEEFLEEGDAVFREDNLDIADAFETLKSKGFIDTKMQAYFRSRMLDWTERQTAFAQGRKDRLDDELDGLEPAVVLGLKNEIFTNFDASIEAAEKRAVRRQAMSFFELANDMGYAA